MYPLNKKSFQGAPVPFGPPSCGACGNGNRRPWEFRKPREWLRFFVPGSLAAGGRQLLRPASVCFHKFWPNNEALIQIKKDCR